MLPHAADTEGFILSALSGPDLLRTLMKTAGDNTNSLSAKLNNKTTQPQIFKFLNDTTKEPKRSTLSPIADHYGVPVDAFFQGSGISNEGVASQSQIDTSPRLDDQTVAIARAISMLTAERRNALAVILGLKF